MSASQFLGSNASTTPAAPGASKSSLYPDSNGDWTQIQGAAGTAKKLIGGGANYSATPADPTGTASATLVMMGLAGSITPVTTGRILITICGNMTNSTGTAGNGAKSQLSYGTGAAPANAAALTGTQVGTAVTATLMRAASDLIPFSLTALVTGLTVGTAYWLDLALAAVTANTGQAKNLTVSVVEL